MKGELTDSGELKGVVLSLDEFQEILDDIIGDWTPTHKSTTIEDVFFELSCYACPEQYDVYYKGKQVGYVRLRHGTLRVHAPEAGGKIIYEVNWPEEEYLGLFPDDESREFHLTTIARILKERTNAT